MIKLLLDTNVLLSIVDSDRPLHDEALQLAEQIEQGGYVGGVSASSLKDFYYIIHRLDKTIEESKLRALIAWFMESYEVIPVDEEACRRALDSDEPDYEDGIIRAAAEIWGADCLVSDDKSGFAHSSIPKLSVSEFNLQ